MPAHLGSNGPFSQYYSKKKRTRFSFRDFTVQKKLKIQIRYPFSWSFYTDCFVTSTHLISLAITSSGINMHTQYLKNQLTMQSPFVL